MENPAKVHRRINNTKKLRKLGKMTKQWNIAAITFALVCYSIACTQVIPQGAQLETLATGFLQPEGPVWIDSLGLLFSDIMANKIYRWSPETKSVSVYMQPSDSSNGLTLDAEGRLILTQMLKRRVVRREHDGTLIPLAETFRGKKFNSPNDLVVHSSGSIFFTDPDFNVPVGQQKELPFKGIYRISPSGSIQLLDSTFDKPNGICFSPDEKRLYVNESQQRKIYVWDVLNDSTISNKRLFASISQTGYADGMKTDTAGNLYCTGPGGVYIFSPSGTYLGKISTPINPSNCAWGDADRKTLYITAGYGQGVLYRIRLAPTTVVEKQQLPPESIYLFQNYPNPCNPSTVITYQLNEPAIVSLDIIDALGREVTSFLCSTPQHEGTYSFPFHGSQYSSGVYFYRLTVRTQKATIVRTRSFVVLK